MECVALQRGEAERGAGAVVLQDEFDGAMAEAAMAVVEEDLGGRGGRRHAEKSIACNREPKAQHRVHGEGTEDIEKPAANAEAQRQQKADQIRKNC